MLDDFFSQVNELKSKGESFCIAIITNIEKPISGKPGNKIIIKENGEVLGWLAGGCSQPLVVEAAKEAMQRGEPRTIKISPEISENTNSELIEYQMSCHSGGSMEVYLEPIMPNTHIIIYGKSAVAKAIVKISKAMQYKTTVLAPDAVLQEFDAPDLFSTQFTLPDIPINKNTFAIISTQGEDDELALQESIKANIPNISFVASSKKLEGLKEILQLKGLTADQIARIKSPAGIDIKAKLPEEIAISIVAEIVEIIRSGKTTEAKDETYDFTVDPICGMKVQIDSAGFSYEYDNTTYYFCCDGCRELFMSKPETYLAQS